MFLICKLTGAFGRKSVMIWQKYGVIQNVRHSGKRGGKTGKKVTKNYVAEGFTAKKCRDYAGDVLVDTDLFCCIFY